MRDFYLKQVLNMNNDRHSELLMPAGSLEKLKAAILYGADAVYMGTPDLSLRTKSKMTLDDVVEGISFAHAHKKRVYLTLNLFSHNKDIDKLPDYVETVKKVKPDGLIVADPGIFSFVKQMAPELELHISTQANVCSWQSVKFWANLGAKLCVLAREVSFEELREIRKKCPDIKLETFIHGSMCMTYSGRCLLSNFLAERGANQGACANSCRWKYKVHMKLKDGTVKELPLSEENLELFEFFLEEECRPGELMPIEEDERGSYILNSKDLCLMPRLDELLRIGIDSLKVEGRGKSIYYAALTARAYRMAIDDWYAAPDHFNPAPYMEELATIPNRGYTLAFHDGRVSNYGHSYEMNWNFAGYEYAGIIKAVLKDAFLIEAKNKLVAGDVLEFVSPTRREIMLLRIYEFIEATTGRTSEVVQPSEKPIIRLAFELFDHETIDDLIRHFPPMTVIRKEKALTNEQWDQIKLDREAGKMELGANNQAHYLGKKEELIRSIEKSNKDRTPKTRRVGLEGCCGKGCNGCLMFWHEPKYAKARELLAQKKQGEMLERNMRDDLIEG
jgi:putative protease